MWRRSFGVRSLSSQVIVAVRKDIRVENGQPAFECSHPFQCYLFIAVKPESSPMWK